MGLGQSSVGAWWDTVVIPRGFCLLARDKIRSRCPWHGSLSLVGAGQALQSPSRPQVREQYPATFPLLLQLLLPLPERRAKHGAGASFPLCLQFLERQGLSVTWETVEPARSFICRGKGVLPQVSAEERRDLEEITPLGARTLRLMLLS